MADKKPEETPGEEGRPLTEEELKIAYDGPAIAANRCFIVLAENGVRITFAEQDRGGIIHFRNAVALSIQQGISLKDTLSRLLGDVEKQIAAVEAAVKDDG